MKYYAFLITLLTFASTAFGQLVHPFSTVPSPLQRAVDALSVFPETREIFTHIRKEGEITLKWLPLGSQNFYALWLGQERTIVLNSSRRWSEGKKISSILFELHNAVANSQLIALDYMAWNKRMNMRQYVESVERLEYQNVKKTSQLIDKAIRLGYFPVDATCPVHANFNDHYRLQIQGGHSAFIAQRYNELAQ